MIFFGGEDYKLVCAISEEDLSKINPDFYTIIGEIIEKNDENYLKINMNDKIFNFDENKLEEKFFKHF